MKRLANVAMLVGTSWLMISAGATCSRADDSITDLTTNANAAIRASDYATGIRLLEQAISQDGDNPSLSYNLAIARYRHGDIEIARQLFTEVAAAEDAELAAKARYNLGNADFAEAIQKLEQDPAAARKQLESAIENYRKALQINRTDSDARANIELANRLIDQLQNDHKEDQSKEDQSKEDQSKEDQSKEDQSKEDQSKEDQSKEDQSKEDQSKEDQSKQQESEQNKSSDQPAEETQEPKQTPDPDQKQDPSNQAPDSPPKSASNESKPSNQKQDRTPAEDGKPKDAASKENGAPPPAGELSSLNEQSPLTTEPATPSSEILRDDQTMTQQEAQKMLQAVRDRELRRRLQQLQQSQFRRLRVDKDW